MNLPIARDVGSKEIHLRIQWVHPDVAQDLLRESGRIFRLEFTSWKETGETEIVLIPDNGTWITTKKEDNLKDE